jgi:hypothetical protein
MATDIYGEVSNLQDIRDINRKIRQEMNTVGRRDQLTELKKRSDYLCTLTLAPPGRSGSARRAASTLRSPAKKTRRLPTKPTASPSRRASTSNITHGEEVDHGQQTI